MTSGIVEALVTNVSVKTLLIAVVVALSVYWLIQKRKYRLPPGPFALPLIGNYEFYADKSPHKSFYKLSKTYGPVLRVYLGPSPWIILNNVDVTIEALVKKGADFADRPKLTSTDVFTEGGKDIVLGQYGPTWKLHRKIAGKALRYYLHGRNLEETLEKACTKVIKLMCEEKGPFDPTKYLDFVVFNILCNVCFGTSYELNDPEFVKLMKLDNDLLEKIGYGLLEDVFPYFKDIMPSKRYTECVQLTNELLDIMRVKFKEHKDTFDKNHVRDFTDSLLLARKEAEEEGDEELLSQLTETHLVQTLADIFFAGIDTSRITLNWALLHMAAYQDIQAKVQEELDNAVGKNRYPCIKDRENLGYTEAVLHECMRVNVALPLGVPHQTLCDTQVGGFDIPKGTRVIINHWALHHDPAYWKDVDKFDPYRYLDSKGKLDAKPESWLPFSAGRRVCLGEPIAKPELHLVFAALLQKFKIKLPPGVTTKFEESEMGIFSPFPKKYEIVIEERY